MLFTSACGTHDPLEDPNPLKDPEPAENRAPAGAVPADDAPAVIRTAALEPDSPQRRSLQFGDVDQYSLALEAGEFLQVAVRQLEGDVALEVSGPAGQTFPKIDTEARPDRIEPVFLVAEVGGTYRLSVMAFKPGAEYEIRSDPIRAPTPTDRDRSKANWTFCRARSLRLEDPARAAEDFRQAARGWSLVGDGRRQAEALYELGEILPRGSEHLNERADAYQRALKLFEEAGDARREARCLHRLGGIASRGGELEKSRDLFAASLAKWRTVGNLHEVSVVSYDRANAERRVGQPEAARKLFLEALEVAPHNAWPRLHRTRIQTELGALYFYRGETSRGIREYRAALQILDQHPRPEQQRIRKQRSLTLTRLATGLYSRDEATVDEIEEARALLEAARRLREALKDKRGIALTANSLGLLYEKMNRPRLALQAFRLAEENLLKPRSAPDLAVVRGNRCRIVERLGNPESARACYLEALDNLRQVEFRSAEAQCLVDLANNARHRGDLHDARSRIRDALEVYELIRGDSHSDDLRSSFRDRKHSIYQLAIDLALDLHQAEPEGGHAEAAFHDLESARARGFLETLVRYRPELDLPSELRDLRAEIHRVKVESLAAPTTSAKDAERLEHQLAELLERHYQEQPRFAFVEPEILSITEAQKLLDSETLLLVYHLGEQRSAVWAITDSQVRWHPLPPRSRIEETALDLNQAMSSGAHRLRTWRRGDLSQELSAMILGPVADLLERPRLAVVPAGALRYVPFASLPHPRARTGAETNAATSAAAESKPTKLLVETHQITSTPSASVLAALRKRSADRTPASAFLALVGAPVLHPGDERLKGRADSSTANDPSPLITPLPHTLAEAKAILDLVDGQEVHTALGLDANRESVFGEELKNVQIVHFATHGHLDDAHGELSGLTLSQFDHSGRRVDGYVWAYELYDLDLRADLVVLSACETALGKAVRGEGLVGLTRGLLYAGAQRVLVSLWSVNDEATAQLMKHFYHGLVHDDLHPAEALRQAQMTLRDGAWPEPYYWAPFVLQGDWQPGPALRTQSSSARGSRKEKVSAP